MPKTEIVSYRVLRPVTHDKNRYAAGETIDLAGADSAPLLRLGAIAPAEPPPKAAPKK